jgi:PhoH-like ATPase
MKKTYVVDTSVIMHDPLFFEKFEEHNIVVPILVLEELSKLKSSSGLKGFQAREAGRRIKELFDSDSITSNAQVTKGIKLKTGGTLRVELNHLDLSVLPNALDKNITDYKIVAMTKSLKEELNQDKEVPVIMVSKDIDIWILCKALDLRVEDYRNDKIKSNELYDGIVNKEVNKLVIDKLYKDKSIKLKEVISDEDNIYPNSGLLLNSSSSSAVGIYKNMEVRLINNNTALPLTPKNLEQKVAVELLMDNEIDLTTVTGGAGSGKTFLTLFVAFHKLLKTREYDKVILIKPTQETDLGYLPGTELEKLNPYMASYYDAFSKILPYYVNGKLEGESTIKTFIMDLIEEGKIEMKNFSYLRGRSLDNSFIIVDECQQITPHFAKLVLTRAGHNTKIVLLGDVSDNQIDVSYVDSKSNGLAYVVEKFKESDIVGHVTLKSVERSRLAKVAGEYL